MSQRTIVCFYVSGHGLGHASRAVQVMAALPPRFEIIVKSTAPTDFLQRESGRKLEIHNAQFDLGACQTSNRVIDWKCTFREARRIQRECEAGTTEELQFLRDRKVCAVVSDSAAFPLRLARMMGIPGVAISNFTWVEIFRRAAPGHEGGVELLRKYAHDYSQASLALRTPMALRCHPFRNTVAIPLIARRGRSRRTELLNHLGLPESQKLVLLYFGNWGSDTWPLAADDPKHLNTTFLGFSNMPPPVRQLNPAAWSFPDVVASVDVVVAKPGYGTTGECMANGTPMVYHPRRVRVCEYTALRRDVLQWGGGVQISTRDFEMGRWYAALQQALQLGPPRVPSHGASVAADQICSLIK